MFDLNIGRHILAIVTALISFNAAAGEDTGTRKIVDIGAITIVVHAMSASTVPRLAVHSVAQMRRRTSLGLITAIQSLADAHTLPFSPRTLAGKMYRYILTVVPPKVDLSWSGSTYLIR
jgi:hypothetical protein